MMGGHRPAHPANRINSAQPLQKLFIVQDQLVHDAIVTQPPAAVTSPRLPIGFRRMPEAFQRARFAAGVWRRSSIKLSKGVWYAC